MIRIRDLSTWRSPTVFLSSDDRAGADVACMPRPAWRGDLFDTPTPDARRPRVNTSAGRPGTLVVTFDEHFLDDLLRLAVATGVDLEVDPDDITERGSCAHTPIATARPHLTPDL